MNYYLGYVIVRKREEGKNLQPYPLYYFWPSFSRTDEDSKWKTYTGDKNYFWLRSNSKSPDPDPDDQAIKEFYDALVLSNNEVIQLSLTEDIQIQRDGISISKDDISKIIQRAAEIKLLPILHRRADVGIQEHIVSECGPLPPLSKLEEQLEVAENSNFLAPVCAKKIKEDSRKPTVYQCGPAYVNGAAVLEVDGGYLYRCNYPDMHAAGVERYRLRDGAKPFVFFEDGEGEEKDGKGHYIFPRYVFEDDLEVTESLPDHLYDKVIEYRPNYEDCRNDIMSIAIDLTQNLLTVFSGDPGCGKTSICNIFAQVLGLRGTDRYVVVPVERGWTSKRDFIGYYNSILGGLVTTNAGLYHGLKTAGQMDAPMLVLLDEANLSPMEYYWSDFMQIAGSDENEAERTISFGGKEDTEKTYVSPQCRFAATINNDHTTEELSPRIIDRAAVVSLPSKDYKKGAALPKPEKDPNNLPVSWSELQRCFGGSEEELPEDGDVSKVYRGLTDLLREAPARVIVSHRAEKAIRRFWSAARQEGVFEGETQENRDIAALDYAVAQRLLPKLAGSGEGFREQLEKLKNYCEGAKLDKCKDILVSIMERGGEADSALSYYSFF